MMRIVPSIPPLYRDVPLLPSRNNADYRLRSLTATRMIGPGCATWRRGLDDASIVEQIAHQAREPASFRETRRPRRYDNRVVNGTNIMSERFTETLRAASEPGWSDAVGHRFVKELFVGTIPDAVMARYLIQHHRFIDSFLILLGAALASADTFEARLRFGRFIGMVSSGENRRAVRSDRKCQAGSSKGRYSLACCHDVAGPDAQPQPSRGLWHWRRGGDAAVFDEHRE